LLVLAYTLPSEETIDMSKIDPGKDAAGVGPYARERERLVPLSELHGWDITAGGADVRSWEVKTLSGRVIGTVRDLLVDAGAHEVVMLDIDLTGSDRHAYVPLRVVEIDRARRVVRADSGDLEEHTLADHATPERVVRDREVHEAASDTERVIERRPIVEETVVRRRDVSEPDSRP
jgi:hypothetical protein